jgi:hypothetical protein
VRGGGSEGGAFSQLRRARRKAEPALGNREGSVSKYSQWSRRKQKEKNAHVRGSWPCCERWSCCEKEGSRYQISRSEGWGCQGYLGFSALACPNIEIESGGKSSGGGVRKQILLRCYSGCPGEYSRCST